MKKDPANGTATLNFFIRAYKNEWKDFIEERDRMRLVVADPGAKKSDFRQIAGFPPFIIPWLKFINVGQEPTNEFKRQFIKDHPVFWMTEKPFLR